ASTASRLMQLDPSKLRQRITRLFEENFQKFGDLGAAVSIWQNGKALVDLYGGFKDARRQEPWTDDTLVLIWSATNGLGSACVLHVLQEHKIDIERRVTEFWAEFAQGGKKNITLAQLLSHQAGLPAKENSRVATMYAPKAGKPTELKQFYADLTTPGTLAHRSFSSPRGLHAISAMNDPAIRAQSFVSFGGIGSANSLAKFYAMLAHGGQSDGRIFFAEKTMRWMRTTLTDGIDRVFQTPTAFSAGFMKDSKQSTRPIFGRSAFAFGHPGAGGSHAFADPRNKISFAYVMNQMEQSNEKSLGLVEAIYR